MEAIVSWCSLTRPSPTPAQHPASGPAAVANPGLREAYGPGLRGQSQVDSSSTHCKAQPWKHRSAL